jgi:hypothetical protein
MILSFILIPVEHADGISLSPALADSPCVWRLPFGLQLVFTSIVIMGLLSVRESARRLASVCQAADAQVALTYLHHAAADAPTAGVELAEI